MNKFEKTKGEGKSMQNKQNTKAKVIVIAIAILLCLALAVGITGAFYQARRRATGTVKMDKGIVIDYTGFGKDTDGIWVRENETTFRLFEDADVQPGEKISLNDAGIRANASSVDFYARVKLSYEFYNGETKLETLPASFKASDLITTSATFFGSDWVKSSDGYHYYGVDTTLSKFTKATPAGFVDLFDTNAQFIIEGAGFTGAYPDGEGGGFVVGDTSINKIVVYLTLETLQGDATAEQAKALGWEITESDISSVIIDMSDKSGDIFIDDILEEDKDQAISVTGSPTNATTMVIGSKAFYGCTNLKLNLSNDSNITYIIATDAFSEGAKITYGGTDVTSLVINPNTDGKTAGRSNKWKVAEPNLNLFLPSELTNSSGSYGDYEYTDAQGIWYFDIVDEYGEKVYAMSSSVSGGVSTLRASTLNGTNNYTARINHVKNKTELTKIVMPTYIGSDAYSEKFKVTAIDTTVNYWNFWENQNSFTEVILPKEVNIIGQSTFSSCSQLTSISIPKTVTYIHFQGAFSGSDKLDIIVDPENTIYKSLNGSLIEIANRTLISIGTDLTIPEDGSVEIVGYAAFGGRKNLQNLTIPSIIKEISAFAFSGCTNLKYITISNGVEKIGNSAFYECNNIVSIQLPQSVTSIGNYAFATNSNLEQINVTSGNSYYSSYSNCLIDTLNKKLILGCQNSTIPTDGSVTKIAASAFSNCGSLTSITIPDAIINVESDSFWGCDNLTTITIGAGVSDVSWLPNSIQNLTISESNNYLISDSKAIFTKKSNNTLELGKYISSDATYSIPASFTINDVEWNLTNIGANAFADKYNLTSVIIPEGVKTIGEYAFPYANDLLITLPDSIETIGECAMSGVKLNKLPANLKEVGSYAFQMSQFVADTITLNANILGESAFSNCNVKSIQILGQVTYIAPCVFENCQSLQSIVLPSSIEIIEDGAFSGCSSLTTIFINSNNSSVVQGLGFAKADDKLYNENGIEDASGTYYKYSGAIA